MKQFRACHIAKSAFFQRGSAEGLLLVHPSCFDNLLWRREHGRSARGRPWRARGSRAACGRGRGGVECARRLMGRGRLDRRLRRCTKHSSLLPLTPIFFGSPLTCHTTQCGIAKHQISFAKISRKIRLQRWAGCARRDGVSAAAAPGGARGEPTALVPPAEGATGYEMCSAR